MDTELHQEEHLGMRLMRKSRASFSLFNEIIVMIICIFKIDNELEFCTYETVH